MGKRTQFFFNLEKKHKNCSTIRGLKIRDTLVFEESEINLHINEFYAKLYAKPEVSSAESSFFLIIIYQSYQRNLSRIVSHSYQSRNAPLHWNPCPKINHLAMTGLLMSSTASFGNKLGFLCLRC